MNLIDPLIQLFNLDSKTLIGALVWGNLAMGAVICLYEFAGKQKIGFGSIRGNMAVIRFCNAFGYLCLFLRGNVPGIVSVNIGNSVVYLCFYFEYRLLLEATNLYNKKMHILGTSVVVLSIVVFNLLELLFHNASLRIGIASAIIFLLSLPPALVLLTAKHTNKFKRGIGLFYFPLLVALIPRCVEGFSGKIISIETNRYYQTLMFGSLALLVVSNTIIYLLFLKEKADTMIEKMANYDNLTDVMNRHNFFVTGNMFFAKQKERGHGLSVLFFDIDFFKKVNDRFGHQFGDEVLIRFADTIKSNIRPADLCCRYGGEEFVVLADTNEDGCKIIAERILRETENIAFDSEPDFHMTTSIGCITGVPKPDETLENFIGKADKALYMAKKDGRNKAVFYPGVV